MTPSKRQSQPSSAWELCLLYTQHLGIGVPLATLCLPSLPNKEISSSYTQGFRFYDRKLSQVLTPPLILLAPTQPPYFTHPKALSHLHGFQALTTLCPTPVVKLCGDEPIFLQSPSFLAPIRLHSVQTLSMRFKVQIPGTQVLNGLV